ASNASQDDQRQTKSDASLTARWSSDNVLRKLQDLVALLLIIVIFIVGVIQLRKLLKDADQPTTPTTPPTQQVESIYEDNENPIVEGNLAAPGLGNSNALGSLPEQARSGHSGNDMSIKLGPGAYEGSMPGDVIKGIYNSVRGSKLAKIGRITLISQGELTDEWTRVTASVPALGVGNSVFLQVPVNAQITDVDLGNLEGKVELDGFNLVATEGTPTAVITYTFKKTTQNSSIEAEQGFPVTESLQKEFDTIPPVIRAELDAVKHASDAEKLRAIEDILWNYFGYDMHKIVYLGSQTWMEFLEDTLDENERFNSICNVLAHFTFIFQRYVDLEAVAMSVDTSGGLHRYTYVEIEGQWFVFDPTIIAPIVDAGKIVVEGTAAARLKQSEYGASYWQTKPRPRHPEEVQADEELAEDRPIEPKSFEEVVSVPPLEELIPLFHNGEDTGLWYSLDEATRRTQIYRIHTEPVVLSYGEEQVIDGTTFYREGNIVWVKLAGEELEFAPGVFDFENGREGKNFVERVVSRRDPHEDLSAKFNVISLGLDEMLKLTEKLTFKENLPKSDIPFNVSEPVYSKGVDTEIRYTGNPKDGINVFVLRVEPVILPNDSGKTFDNGVTLRRRGLDVWIVDEIEEVRIGSVYHERLNSENSKPATVPQTVNAVVPGLFLAFLCNGTAGATLNAAMLGGILPAVVVGTFVVIGLAKLVKRFQGRLLALLPPNVLIWINAKLVWINTNLAALVAVVCQGLGPVTVTSWPLLFTGLAVPIGPDEGHQEPQTNKEKAAELVILGTKLNLEANKPSEAEQHQRNTLRSAGLGHC
ncbi:hypothetical protein ACFL2I_05930, partial [Candidatus Omnitrophota bacterium]